MQKSPSWDPNQVKMQTTEPPFSLVYTVKIKEMTNYFCMSKLSWDRKTLGKKKTLPPLNVFFYSPRGFKMKSTHISHPKYELFFWSDSTRKPCLNGSRTGHHEKKRIFFPYVLVTLMHKICQLILLCKENSVAVSFLTLP